MTVNDYKIGFEDKESQLVDPMAAYISHFEHCAGSFGGTLNNQNVDLTKTAPFIFG